MSSVVGGILTGVLVIIGVLIVGLVVYWIMNWIWNELLYSLPIKVEVFSISPTSIRTGKLATLTITVLNRGRVSRNVTINLDTDPKVNIYEIGGLLPRTGRNFTYVMTFGSQKERETKTFNVSGIVGTEDSTDYRIDGYFYTGDLATPIMTPVTITIRRE